MTDPDRPTVTGDLVDPPIDDLVGYLRRYGDRYTREAMAARLIEAGHDPDAVEAALAELDATVRATAEADEHAQARLVGRVIVGIAFLALLVWLLGIAPRAGPGVLGFNAAVVGLVALFGGGAIWWIGRVRSLGAIVGIALVAVLLGLPLTFLGACLAYFGTGGPLFG